MLALILLLDSLVPLSKEVEGIWVGHVINKHYQIGLSKKLECDLFENVLPGYIDAVELHSLIWVIFIKLNIFDMILTSLSHHILMVKRAVDSLVNETSLSYRWFSSNHHSCAKYRHF